MSDEEYHREKAEIKVRLKVTMELLQKEEEDQRCAFLVKIKLNWHNIQRRREQLMNAQYEEEILKARECLMEVLKTEASSETKRSQCFETDILCVLTSTKNEEKQFANIVIKNEGEGQNLNYVHEENETAESHVHGNAQLSERNGFYLTVKDENKEDLAYDDGQELKET